MNEVFYIVIIVIFGVFVILTLYWLWRYMHKKSILEMKQEDLTEDQKLILSKFCEEMRKTRLADTVAVNQSIQIPDNPVIKKPRKKLI